MQLLQDVLLPRGGAERVFWALDNSHKFANSIIGLSDFDVKDEGARRRILCRLEPGEEADPRKALRRLVETAHRQPEVKTPTLVLHHHAGLQFALQKDMATLYLHTPTRFLWEPQRASWELGVFDCQELEHLRVRELQNVQAAHRVVTNSRYTAERVMAAYGRSASVVNPPCELWRIPPRAAKGLTLPDGGYVITVSRLVATKGLKRLIEETSAIGIALVIVGSGRAAAPLQRSAGDHVLFVEDCDDPELRWLLRNSRMFVSFSREDFGLAAAEALCEGVPCVVPAESGIGECIGEGSGAVFHLDHPGTFKGAMETASAIGRIPTPTVEAYRQHFSHDRFVDTLVGLMSS